MVNPFKTLFGELLKPKEKAIDDPDLLMSRVIYNTRNKFIILITYGTNIFYPMIELQAQSYRAGIRISVANSAVVKEPEKDNEEFVKTQIKLIDNKHYALIAGSPEQFADLFKYVDLANPIMLELVQDIYHYCDSSIFSDLITDGVLEHHRFTHKNIEPKYDSNVIEWFINNKKFVLRDCDDIVGIFKNIPNVFDPFDVLRLLDVCIAIHRRSVNKAYLLIAKYGEQDEVYQILTSVLKEIGVTNALEGFTTPIYKRIVKEYDDDDGPNMVGMKTSDLDEVFTQEYDRFSTPTVDFMSQLDTVSVDEALSSEEDPVE